MKVVFINRFFYPDEVATSLMLTDLACALAAQGLAVEVVTSRLHHADAGVCFAPRESVRGVQVRRVWTSRFGRGRLLGRACDYLSFYVSALLCLLRCVRRGDVVVAKTDPPMVSVIARLVCAVRGARQVNWMQDVFPEAMLALGLRLPGPALAALRVLRDWSLRGARANVVLGTRMQERLQREVRGLRPDRLVLIPNWSRDGAVRPVPAGDNPLRRAWGLEGQFVVGYSGNLGRAHEFETFLQAAHLLQTDPRWSALGRSIVFLFIGSGAGLAPVQAAVAQRGLTRVRFEPFQPMSQLAFSLSVPDVHLVSLLPAAEGLIVPSKYYGVAAAGRSCAFVGDTDGELARILGGAGSGAAFAPGDSEGLADWLAQMATQPGACADQGSKARQWFDQHGGFDRALAAWKKLILEMS